MRRIAISLIVLIAFAASIYFSPQMPEQMASHWNASGNVDGYLPKTWGLFLMPFVIAFAGTLLYFIPLIDPLKANIEKFRNAYDGFIIIMLLFLLFVHFQTLLWNAGTKINPSTTIPVGLGVLFIYIGFLLKKSKRNWFIGIRTPWTLSSDEVWEKTHALASKLFMAAGPIILLSVIFSEHVLVLTLVPILIAAFVPIVYSYFVFRKLQ